MWFYTRPTQLSIIQKNYFLGVPEKFFVRSSLLTLLGIKSVVSPKMCSEKSVFFFILWVPICLEKHLSGQCGQNQRVMVVEDMSRLTEKKLITKRDQTLYACTTRLQGRCKLRWPYFINIMFCFVILVLHLIC